MWVETWLVRDLELFMLMISLQTEGVVHCKGRGTNRLLEELLVTLHYKVTFSYCSYAISTSSSHSPHL